MQQTAGNSRFRAKKQVGQAVIEIASIPPKYKAWIQQMALPLDWPGPGAFPDPSYYLLTLLPGVGLSRVPRHGETHPHGYSATRAIFDVLWGYANGFTARP